MSLERINPFFREALYQTVPCAVFMVDIERKIIFWNRSAEELTGYTSAEMLGKDCAGVKMALCLTNEESGDTDICPLVLEGGGTEMECEIRRRDGGIVPVMRRSRGVYDDRENLIGAIEALVDVSLIKSARNEIRALKQAMASAGRFGELVGDSEVMRKVYELIEMVADSDASIVIEGETGTGKELAARTIHKESGRSAGRFVAINCGALPESLLEAELFGHKKGAFTGAVSDRAGCFETASGGTLLLDEIGELPSASQVKLLRVLQEGEVTRVGDSLPRKVDVRILSATNRSLSDMVEKKEFRSDLFYRLQVVKVRLPALRERKEDLADLAGHFIEGFNEKYGRKVRGVSAEAMRAMHAYDWPGNVRELMHAIEHAFVVLPRGDERIEAGHLPESVQGGRGGETRPGRGWEAYTEDDRGRLLRVLQEAGGNKAHAARLLGITRAGLYKKMKRLGV